jgi:hypothetical protein
MTLGSSTDRIQLPVDLGFHVWAFGFYNFSGNSVKYIRAWNDLHGNLLQIKEESNLLPYLPHMKRLFQEAVLEKNNG